MRFVIQEVEWIAGEPMSELLRDPFLFWRPFHGNMFGLSPGEMDRFTLRRYIELHDIKQTQ